MPDDQASSYQRFAREVSAAAPLPGNGLASATMQLRGESYVLHVIEGPAADSIGFLGMATNFERTRMLRFALHGPLIERLNDLPRQPYQPVLTHRFRPIGDGQASDLVVAGATAVFSTVRAADRMDPDGAAVAYDLFDGERVSAAITGYQRGWYWELLLVAVGLAIWVVSALPGEGQAIELMVEQEAGAADSLFEVSGAVAFRASLSG